MKKNTIVSLLLAVLYVVMTLYIPILVGDAIDCIVEAGNVDLKSKKGCKCIPFTITI